MAYGFRSEMYQRIFREGIDQGFKPERRTGSGHAYLICPQCHERTTFTLTGRGRPTEVRNTVAELRRHGFTWKGRGGTHRKQEQEECPTEHRAPS